jgi:hypothetical protein
MGTVGEKTMMVVAMVAVLAAGCQTPYQTMGPIRGGYEDNPVGDGMYVVHVKVNGFTSRGKAMAYAYRRASELCEHGYSVVDGAQGGAVGVIVGQSWAQTYEKPEVTLAIRCSREAEPVDEAPPRLQPTSESGWWCVTASGGAIGACYREREHCEAMRSEWVTEPGTSECIQQQKVVCFIVSFQPPPPAKANKDEMCHPTWPICDQQRTFTLDNPNRRYGSTQDKATVASDCFVEPVLQQ